MMTKKDQINQLLLDKQEELAHLGNLEQLKKYLNEEFKELDLSNGWDKIEIKPNDNVLPNPNNILLYYLIGTHEKPAKLEHYYEGDGDICDIDCLDGETLVFAKTAFSNDETIVKISELNVGDYIKDDCGNFVEIIAISKRKRKPNERLYRIVWDDLSTTICSSEHKWLHDADVITTYEYSL
ncbi:MAG: hypothetical protein NZZ41_08005, partial [Candidatus Dojkabacteria bacterium]|nr:hypothetical protein [Candidatus Dojkabacteria bacterium]